MVLRTAVVGAGIVSRNDHLPALERNPRTELAAVCDLDRDAARDAADEYGCASFVDPDRLLEVESLDWLHVATPVQTHADLTVSGLEGGIPVLVQKPAATTVAELERMRTAADDAGVPFSVVHNWLYYPIVRGGRDVAASADEPDADVAHRRSPRVPSERAVVANPHRIPRCPHSSL